MIRMRHAVECGSLRRGNFCENYKCGSSRNYTDYCSEETDRLIDQQSQELDRTRRFKVTSGI